MINKRVVRKDGHESQNRQACDSVTNNFFKAISTDYQYLANHNALRGEVADILAITFWNFATCYTWAAEFIEAERFMNMANGIIEQTSEIYQKFNAAKSDISKNAAKQRAFKNSQSTQNRNTPNMTQQTTSVKQQDSDSNPFLKIIAFIVVCVGLYYGCFSSPSKTSKPTSNGKTYNASSNIRPRANIRTGYEANAPILNNSGMCQLTIDNTQNREPVYVRLWMVSPSRPVRAFTIASNGSFTLNNLTPGTYELRYKYLYENREAESGAKSQSFNLTQYETETGTRYSVTTITLYKVSNGNFRTSRINANEI